MDVLIEGSMMQEEDSLDSVGWSGLRGPPEC